MAKRGRQGDGGGRPPKYSNQEDLLAGINEFLGICEEGGHLPEKAGLTVHLGISRDTYNQYRVKFPDAIRYADSEIERAWVRRLALPGATGAIFYLKNAFREHYADRTETDITTKGEQLSPGSVDIEALAVEAAKLLKEKKL